MTYITYQAQSGIPKDEGLVLDMTKNVPNGVYSGIVHTAFWCDAPTVVQNALLPDTIPDPTDPTKQIPNPAKFYKAV
jgi:hypothetical protein